MLGSIIISLGTILSFNNVNADNYKTYDDISIYSKQLDEFNKKSAVTEPKTSNNNSNSKTLEEVLEEQYKRQNISWTQNLPVKDEYEFSMIYVD